MKILSETGREDLAIVYIGETEKGRVEFVESLQPPFSRKEKWVIIISTLYGCPIECKICDAGGTYKGKLSKDDIFAQIDHVVDKRFADRKVESDKFKIQFARVGEPSFNNAVLDVLRELPKRYSAPGLMPCISTVAPEGCDGFFDELLEIKNELYSGSFQLQFSIHSTDESERDVLIPTNKWNLEKIAEYGKRFYKTGDRKITLNFALAEKSQLDPQKLAKIFDPNIFFIKLTPVNPTFKAQGNGINSAIVFDAPVQAVKAIKEAGFDVLLSIGELEENAIGSNCGQYIRTFEKHSKEGTTIKESYTYHREGVTP